MKFFVVAFVLATALIAGTSAGGNSECTTISEMLKKLSPEIQDHIKTFIKNRPELMGLKPRGLVADNVSLVLNDLLNGLLSHSNLTASDNNIVKALLNPFALLNLRSADSPEAMMMKCIVDLVFDLNF